MAIAGGLALGLLAWPIAVSAWKQSVDARDDTRLVAAADRLTHHPTATRWRALGEQYLIAAQDAGPAGQRFYDELAREAFIKAAGRAPGHARTWLQLAELTIRLDGATAHAAALLARASAAAPERPAFVAWRARRALVVWPVASEADRHVLAGQVTRAWRADPAGIETYAASSGVTDTLSGVLDRDVAGEG